MIKRICVVLFLLVFVAAVYAQSSEYAKRRDSVRNKLDAKSMVILFSTARSASDSYLESRFVQDSDIYYLTGSSEPDLILTINHRYDQLYIKLPAWSDKSNKEIIDIKIKETGFPYLNTHQIFEGFLPYSLRDVTTIYTVIGTSSLDQSLSRGQRFFKKVRERYPHITIKDGSEIIHSMRVIHSKTEIALIRKAAEITDSAHVELMKSTRPGMYEYQLEALCLYVFKMLGAINTAFRPIIGAGINGTEPHYVKNTSRIANGDLIVMDIGARFKMYCGDVTRTIPANGKFTAEQKEFYNIVLKAQLAAIKSIKPGIDFNHPNDIAKEIIQKELENRGLIDKKNPRAVRKFMKHSISHFLGLDVHDVGDTKSKLQPGMIITIEPGLYFDKRGFGIRIEDDVLVTEKGYEVLSHAPKTVSEIEKLMKQEGIGNQKIQ